MNDVVTRQAVIPPELAGFRLDRAAAQLWTEFSRSRIQQWIESGALTLDGARAEPRHKLKGGETIAVDAEIETVLEAEPEAIALRIVYEEDRKSVV